jgi:predicted RNA polymerase sigma factor
MSARLAMIEKMIAAGSSDAFHHYARAMELRSLGRAEEALVAFSGVATEFPDYVPTFLMGGQVAEELGRLPEATDWWTRGLDCAERAGDAHAKGELQAAIDSLA